MTERAQDVAFSYVVPVYNEQEGLEHFYKRLVSVAREIDEDFEILFVNDGSTDETASILRRLASRDSHVRAVELSRNFGHQVALTAGYDLARGHAVVTLDGDCQHPPEVIPQMVARWREGFEVVYTVRQDTDGIGRLRRGIGRAVYRLIGLCTGADLTDRADFRLLDRSVVEAVRSTREHARFLRGLVSWVGFRQSEVRYTADERARGNSRYTLRQLAGMASAGVFNFSVLPLRMAAVCGGLGFAAAVLYAIVSLCLWPLGLAPPAAVHVVALLIGLFGLQFLFLGVLGEYLGRVFEEAKARPLYFVRETVGFPAEAAETPLPPFRRRDEDAAPINVFT